MSLPLPKLTKVLPEGPRTIAGISGLALGDILVPLVVSGLLIAVASRNYLLFHTLAELCAVIVACLLSATAWYTYRHTQNAFLLFLGGGYLWVGVIDLFHALSYKGMGLIGVAGADFATQLWLIARFGEAVLLALSPLFLSRTVSRNMAYLATGAIFGLAVIALMSGLFPPAYVEGVGLTAYKIGAEYAIIGILSAALVVLWKRRDELNRRTVSLLALSIALTIASEVCFTLYSQVDGTANMVGHLFKLASYWMLFLGVVESTLVAPHRQLAKEVATRKQAEAEIRDALKLAEKASQAKSEFLADMSHELRTPLNAIIGFAEAMQSGVYGPLGQAKYVEYVGDIRNSGQHLLTLINDILDLSAIEAGKLEPEDDYLDLAQLFEQTRRLIEKQATAAQVRLRVEAPKEGLCLYADHRRMIQILVNLTSNAVKFTPAGGEVSLTAGVDRRGQLILTVSDDGIGMSRDDIDVALKPFGQLKEGQDLGNDGVGLGLPLTLRLVTAHGGSLRIESRKGRGTQIMVDMPASRVVYSGIGRLIGRPS